MNTITGRIFSIMALAIVFSIFFTAAGAAQSPQEKPAVGQVSPDTIPVSQAPGCCVCPQGSSYDPKRGSCVKIVCRELRGLPDGDKGGGFFALNGNLWENIPCNPAPDLDLSIATGQPGWHVTGPGATGTPVNVTPYYSAWSAPISGSSWISINSGRGVPPGASADYTYTFEFCLCDEGRNTAK